jgi:Zn-dependent alcohol dehydrogenase
MISARIGLEGIDDAFERLRRGDAARQVVVFPA